MTLIFKLAVIIVMAFLVVVDILLKVDLNVLRSALAKLTRCHECAPKIYFKSTVSYWVTLKVILYQRWICSLSLLRKTRTELLRH